MVASEIGSEMNHNLDNDTQGEITSDGDSKALPASQLQAHEHPALPGTHEVIRRLNRDTTWVATGLLGAVIFAALVLALLEYHPKADDLTMEASQTTGRGLLNANPSALGNVAGSNGQSTTEITSQQAMSVDKAPRRAGECNFVVSGKSARFCAGRPTKDPRCKIPVTRAPWIC